MATAVPNEFLDPEQAKMSNIKYLEWGYWIEMRKDAVANYNKRDYVFVSIWNLTISLLLHNATLRCRLPHKALGWSRIDSDLFLILIAYVAHGVDFMAV